MDNEVENLAASLRKGGLAPSEEEALRRAEEMLGVKHTEETIADPVAQDSGSTERPVAEEATPTEQKAENTEKATRPRLDEFFKNI